MTKSKNIFLTGSIGEHALQDAKKDRADSLSRFEEIGEHEREINIHTKLRYLPTFLKSL